MTGKWEGRQWQMQGEGMGGAEFQRATHFLKSNRISLAYGLTSKKDQAFIDKSGFVFLLYLGICRFCAIFGHIWVMAAFGPLVYTFDGHGSPLPVDTYIYMLPYRN